MHRDDHPTVTVVEYISDIMKQKTFGKNSIKVYPNSTVGELAMGTVIRTIWPFHGAPIVALMVVTCVPAFSMWLPQMFGNIPR